MDCIFCKIANGEIPSKTIYEDAEFRVILDLGPAAKGHALILPKKHGLQRLLGRAGGGTAPAAVIHGLGASD